MNIRIIRANEAKTSKWAGGTTSELFIYPSGANYAMREFLFRISVAEATVAHSAYTRLEGVTRYLVSLKGETTLTTEGREPVMLSPLSAVHRFDGALCTEANGAITDFNLMLKGSATGNCVILPEAFAGEIVFVSEFCAIFAASGACVCNEHLLNEGDLLIANGEGALKLMCVGRVIRSDINA